jgi:putative DNA methylase
MQIIKSPKKLIEVALPLDDINAAAAREKSIRHGHPSTLHLWWARRPLAAARAVIFSQMVNDPGYERNLARGINKDKAKVERERLFGILRRLVKWESTTDEAVLAEARSEIEKSWREVCELNKSHPDAATLFNPSQLPGFHDPFAGGGAIPLEGQRLGLDSNASDLNPVAVVINKAMIELPPQVANHSPIGPHFSLDRQVPLAVDWTGPMGLAEDVRRYGWWVREQVFARVGHLYPTATVPAVNGGGEGKVIAWLWARTVKSPNPAFAHVDIPLVTTFVLANKVGKEVYVQPEVSNDQYRFTVKVGNPPKEAKAGTKATGRGSNFFCILSGSPVSGDYIKAEGKAGRLGKRLLAVVTEGPRGRIYVAPNEEMERIAASAVPTWKPQGKLPEKLTGGTCVPYGLTDWADLFTERQLQTLATFSDVIQEARVKATEDYLIAKQGSPEQAKTFGDAVTVYLSFALSRSIDRGSTICSWDSSPKMEALRNTFARQALPMTWDFAEGNPFSESSGNWINNIEWVAKAVAMLPCRANGVASQQDAQRQEISANKVISTDPPYYDNIGYADLSDFFYVWLRRTLRGVFPQLFETMAVPKAEELVATTHRHGGKEQAEAFFLDGMTEAMNRLAAQAHPAFPTTIYYAFKQSDTTDLGTGNTGWETFLEAVLRAGFMLSGTWPMRTELANRMVGSGTNALASSIILVCRKRSDDAQTLSRRDFLRELKDELSEAVEVMVGGSDGISPVAPVDLAQAVIGPGMAVFSKYSAVLEADGSRMTVHTALTLINRMLAEGADEFDADTQFCLGWFDEQGWSAGEFGIADVLARAKGTSVDHVREAGVVEAGSGKVRLLKPAEYDSAWSPEKDNNTPVWEALHQLIRALREHGESAAGVLLAGMPQRAEPIRNLAYRLYTLCERKGWAEDARAYNELITSWTGIEAASHEKGHLGSQTKFDI